MIAEESEGNSYVQSDEMIRLGSTVLLKGNSSYENKIVTIDDE